MQATANWQPHGHGPKNNAFLLGPKPLLTSQMTKWLSSLLATKHSGLEHMQNTPNGQKFLVTMSDLNKLKLLKSGGFFVLFFYKKS